MENLIKKQKNQTGFTLIEIMVAIMIIGVLMVGLLNAFPYAAGIIGQAKQETQAAYLAQEKIEELYQLGYNQIATGTIEVKHYLDSSYPGNFQRETIVTNIDSDLILTSDNSGMKKIVVTLFFISKISHVEKSYELITVMARR